jgi:hypothetical protein
VRIVIIPTATDGRVDVVLTSLVEDSYFLPLVS